ncbi:cytochrome C [Rhodobacterales bacterium 56_14_T64]|nr:cytochrome C [Rhodobacterales bacterium 56_14_T64]
MNQRMFLLPALVVLAVTLALGTPGFTGQDQITDKGVKKRVALMFTAQGAVTTLTDMMAGRVAFQAGMARAAQRTLIRSSSKTVRHFRKPHFDPLSNARPEVWTHWTDFKARADASEQAAKQLNVYSLNGLRRTLPSMLQTCLSCHDRYRAKPNEFVTH